MTPDPHNISYLGLVNHHPGTDVLNLGSHSSNGRCCQHSDQGNHHFNGGSRCQNTLITTVVVTIKYVKIIRSLMGMIC